MKLLMLLTCWLLLFASPCFAGTQDPVHPLDPPDRSSPRATLKTFLDEMNDALAAFKAENRLDAKLHAERAMRCLDLEAEPPAIRGVLGLYSALYLKETLDRLTLPPPADIPDAAAVAERKLAGWTVPYTEITIARAGDGPAGVRFLFSGDTVRNSETFYNKIKHLPYVSGARGAMYEEISSSGTLILPKHIMERLPHWARVTILGETVWQWIGLILYIFAGASAVLLAHKYGNVILRQAAGRIGALSALGGLILPVSLILFAQIGLWFVIYGLHFLRVDVYEPIAYVFLAVSYVGTIWLVGALLNRAAELVIVVGRFQREGMTAQLIRFGFDVVTVAIVLVTAIGLGARLGLPTYSLVTGLGISGLAVALSGREALSNLIGSVMILLDQPFKLGDLIVLGEGDRGTVTDIGLRSTRIRTRDGILVSIPNSTVAGMKIVNESAPVREARIHVPVGVAYGSSVADVESALLAACGQCEYAATEPPPAVRLVKFGDSALEYELLVWIVKPEFRGRALNRLNRAILHEFEQRGIEIPFPQRDIHLIRST